MILTDTHTHLYAEQFNDDQGKMIERAFNDGVTRLFLPNIDNTSIDGMIKLKNTYPGNCFPMMGIHPCSIKEDVEEQLALAKSWLFEKQEEVNFCAVGEIGLDFYWDISFKEQQVAALKKQITWAKELDLPVVLHCRDSFVEVLEVVTEMKDDRLQGVFHCFTGTEEDAQKVIDLGFYLGIGGVVTFKNSGLAAVVESLNMEHLVLETDSPYLTPTPYRGKRNESSYLTLIAHKVAEVKAISVEEVAKKTTANSKKLFKI